MGKEKVIHKVGRRKTSVARAYLKEGSGKITINNVRKNNNPKTLEEYFGGNIVQISDVKRPIVLSCFQLEKYDIYVNIYGGGLSSQAGAIRLAISRCLSDLSPDYKSILNKAKLLSRDDRMVEPKKSGRKKARKKFQFCKR